VNVSGTPGHAAFVADPDNAIYNMARLLPGLEQLGLAIKKRSHPILGNASLTVTQIRGGTAPNIIPGFCEIEIDRRVLPGETRETMLEEFEQYVSNLAGDQALTYSIDNYSFVPASLIDPDHPFVHHTSDAAARILQKPSEIKAFKATCEAPFFSLYRGIPTLICGPGSLEQAHVIDEYVELREVVEAAALYVELAESLLHE
jgi:acetylornithine deacetylase/succinyl-diaminopimelate desuccinylase-like protein